jgi:DNA/RNA endonuclease G (NUC1)
MAAQTLEGRVASLEAQAAELWLLHDHAYERSSMVPAELVGNEHMRWGYPGGECTVLVNDYFITCHDNAKRIPEWVTYHLTSENVGARQNAPTTSGRTRSCRKERARWSIKQNG